MEGLLAGVVLLGCCIVVPALVWVFAAVGLKKRDIPAEQGKRDNKLRSEIEKAL